MKLATENLPAVPQPPITPQGFFSQRNQCEILIQQFCTVVASAKEVMFSSLFVCLSVFLLATLSKKISNGLHETVRESWQWANEQTGYRDCFPDSSVLGDTESG